MACRIHGDSRDSGAANSRRTAPDFRLSSRAPFSSSAREESYLAAATPSFSSPATWSRIRAISGETTTVTPSPSTAGIW
ncbi:hypothetical protein J5W70_06140 [Akkermansia massiliensis]|nr:hypothetical protein [Akkermansia massiliensis]QWP28083.1 hypothetical protein J5W70_06140 [Akkermansia massiliensis]